MTSFPFIATLVAKDALAPDIVADAKRRLAQAGCAPQAPVWLDAGKAADISFEHESVGARAALQGGLGVVDVIVQPAATREKALLIADMDSTMITVECIDELADYAGLKQQIADVTERAMRGELDFAEALSARVSLLKGMGDWVIDQCRAERVKIMPGAFELVRTMAARGARTLLVSGGFTHFAEPVATQIGFERSVANILEIADCAVVGTVPQPIVDAARKRTELEAMIAGGIDRQLALAVGDGANDIPMIEGAGLGVAYHAKEKVRAAADAQIVHGDLSVLLYAQGIPRNDWVKDCKRPSSVMRHTDYLK